MSECETYAKFTAHEQFPNADIQIVQQGQWLFPALHDDDQTKSVYADPKLNAFMQKKKQSVSTMVSKINEAPAVTPEPSAELTVTEKNISL